MRSLLLPATAVALFNTPITASDAPTAAVKNGSYFGVYQPTYDQDLFLGMPFAQPPVNSLRFRNPEPLNTTWTDIKNATEYSPECYGYGSDQWVLGNIISEDCLTINVVRPSNISEGDNLPVGVWIYGGGLTQGGARDPRYNLSYIVEEAVAAGKPFIGVSFNYRLQAFGFMSGTAVHKAGVANLALKDQRLALHWVQENIAAFGGNASEVTIWGESAGARSIGYQLIAYDGRNDGLFRSAVMQSGASAYWPKSFKNASAWDINYNSITDAANCSSAKDTLECLRHVPIDTLSAIFNSTAATSAMYAPSVDGEFLMDVGPKLIGEGKFVHVPILHGANCDEGTAFGKTGINTTEEFYEYLVGTMAYSDDEADVLLKIYGYMYKRVEAYAGDNNQHGPRRFMSQMWARDDVPVYSYRFNVVPAGVSQFLGSTHFTEVAFVFYNLEGNGYNTSVATDPFLNKPDNFKQLARIMTRMWASFIVDQTPNNNGVIDIEWPQYSLDDPQNIVFDANVTDLAYIEPDLFRAEAIAYIHSLYNATS
ncbi:hypothetical protein PInf_008176 [Phytophthora infestans]|nr:hypothetical protein PInf_008176 [Phytophthora infestans]